MSDNMFFLYYYLIIDHFLIFNFDGFTKSFPVHLFSFLSVINSPLCAEAEFKEFEPWLKFKPRLK